MKIDGKKASLAISAIWVLVSIPISEHLYQEVIGEGLLMRIFALLTVASPVWLHYGLRWLMNDASIRGKYLIAVVVLGCVIAYIFSEDYYWNNLTYIPVAMTLFFVFLSRTESFFSARYTLGLRPQGKQPSPPKIAPDKLRKLEEINAKARPLLDVTHHLATEILSLLQSQGGRSPMPEIIHADADAVKAAYSLVYAAYMDKCVREPSYHHTSILVMYQAAMAQNLLPLVIPKIPNTPPLRQSDMESEAFRAPVREMIKLQSKFSTEVISKIKAEASNPFLPIYQNFRPYFSPKTSDDELASMFEDKFSSLFSTAKKKVSLVLP